MRVKSGKRPEYYLLEKGVDKPAGGKYIRKGNIKTAQKIAQRDYGKDVLKVARSQYNLVNNLIEKYDLTKISDIYYKKRASRRELLMPYMISDDEYVREWLDDEYVQMGFHEGAVDYYTQNNERVRSKTEVIIANMLENYGVPYKYEKPLYLEPTGEVRPDFTVLNVRERKEYYWEHLGMLDDPDYLEKNLDKIHRYELNDYFLGDRLIITAETGASPINTKDIERKIKKYLL